MTVVSGWDRIGRQLRHPTGVAGQLVGHVMAIANRRPNSAAIDALDIQPNDDILELGFGPGTAIKAMAALAPLGRVYGVDSSPVMLGLGRRRNSAAIRAGRVALLQSSFEALPLADASIDKALAVNVVYFWADARPVLLELRRVLRPGGLLSIYATDASAMKRWKFAGPDTHRIFDRQTLAEFLRDGGFSGDEIRVREIRVAPNIHGLLATVSRKR